MLPRVWAAHGYSLAAVLFLSLCLLLVMFLSACSKNADEQLQKS